MDEKRILLAELRDWCQQAHAELSAYLIAQQSNFALDLSELFEDRRTIEKRRVDFILKKSAEKKQPAVAQKYMGMLAENLLRLPYCPPQVIDEVCRRIDDATVEIALAFLARIEAMCRDTIAHSSPTDVALGALRASEFDGNVLTVQRNPVGEFNREGMLEIAERGERIAKFIKLQALSEMGGNWYIQIFEQLEKIERARNPAMYGPLSFGRKIFGCSGDTERLAALDMLFGCVDRILFQWKWERVCIEDFSNFDWHTAREACPQSELLSLAYQSPPISSTVIEAISAAVSAIREASQQPTLPDLNSNQEDGLAQETPIMQSIAKRLAEIPETWQDLDEYSSLPSSDHDADDILRRGCYFSQRVVFSASVFGSTTALLLTAEMAGAFDDEQVLHEVRRYLPPEWPGIPPGDKIPVAISWKKVALCRTSRGTQALNDLRGDGRANCLQTILSDSETSHDYKFRMRDRQWSELPNTAEKPFVPPAGEGLVELITIEQLAKLLGLTAKTVKNKRVGDVTAPKAVVAGSGNLPDKYDYTESRTWAFNVWPDRGKLLPASYLEAISRLP